MLAAGLADVLVGDPHPFVRLGFEQHLLDPGSGALLDPGAVADAAAGVFHAVGELVAQLLQLGERRAAAARPRDATENSKPLRGHAETKNEDSSLSRRSICSSRVPPRRIARRALRGTSGGDAGGAPWLGIAPLRCSSTSGTLALSLIDEGQTYQRPLAASAPYGDRLRHRPERLLDADLGHALDLEGARAPSAAWSASRRRSSGTSPESTASSGRSSATTI